MESVHQQTFITSQGDTIVALATPAGSGAIAVIRLSGKDAIHIANQLFKGKDLEQQATHTLHFGKIMDADTIVDEVLLSLFIAPQSYTRENVVEISCHGSHYIIGKIIRLCLQKGARMANPGEFTLRAFLNGQLDLSQAEAVADLIASSSKASHDIAMHQLRGGFSSKLKTLRQELVDFAALIELELDFSEEDVEFANRDKLKDLIHLIQNTIRSLIHSFELGNVIKNGVNTVIAGRPNAGKSTLLNRLLDEERAIVSDIAGTTRDTVEEVLTINGIDFRLIDTAGIREAQDKVEAIGVQKTLEKIESSSILVYVFDAALLSLAEIKKDLEKLTNGRSKIVAVANKSDLLSDVHQTNNLLEELHHTFQCETVAISAKNGNGTDLVKQGIFQSIPQQEDNSEGIIVSNQRHVEALELTYAALDQALYLLSSASSGELVAFELRTALHHLGMITGEIHTDDLLDSIFTRFCIGK